MAVSICHSKSIWNNLEREKIFGKGKKEINKRRSRRQWKRKSADLRGMTMKLYAPFLSSPEVKPHYQMQVSVINRTPLLGDREGLTTLYNIYSVYSMPCDVCLTI